MNDHQVPYNEDAPLEYVSGFSNTVEIGTSYIVKEKRAHIAYQMFSELVTNGWTGLLITRDPPLNVREEYGLTGVETIWLTTIDYALERTFRPQDIGKLTKAIERFLQNGERTVILLGGYEYLVVQNSFGTMIRLIHMVFDKVRANKSNLILTLDPLTMEKKEMALLEKECDKVILGKY